MFINLNNRYHINENNIAYIEHQSETRYVIHFVASQSPLTFNSGILGDSSYSDIRDFLKSQAPAEAQAAGKEG